jgi:hypothetical protein
LAFDAAKTQKAEVIVLNQDFTLDGQSVTATSIEIYPTHLRLNLAYSPDNTAWLTDLSFYLKNGWGKRFDPVEQGLIASGAQDSPEMVSFRLESPFFSRSKSLTLHFTGATWLDKGMDRTKVDLLDGICESLPEGVSLENAIRVGNDWQLTFSAQERKKNATYQLFGYKHYDEAGVAYEHNETTYGMHGYIDARTGNYVEFDKEGFYIEQFVLKDYPFDTVFLTPAFSRVTETWPEVVLEVK